MRTGDLVATPFGRKAVFAALYVGEGAPIGFLWWYLPAKLRLAGVGVGEIATLTAILVLPWTLKFLWAPLIDLLRGPRFGHRHWILAMQLLMGLVLLPVAWLDLSRDLALMRALLLLHAFFAATQDVAIDAWAIGITPAGEHAGVSGWMQAGKYLGRWLFGAGLLLLGQAVSLSIALPVLVAVVWCTGALLLFARDVPWTPPAAGGPLRSFTAVLRDALRRRTTWLGLLVAVLVGAGFEAVGALAGVFLVDRGLNDAGVGWFLSASAGMLLVGSAVGGMVADRLGHVHAVVVFVVSTAAAIGGLAAADALGGQTVATGAVLGFLALTYLAAGMLIAASYGLLMDLTDPRLGATQFSAFMGATNACESWSGFTVGRLVDPRALGLGYPLAFSLMAALSLLALPILGHSSFSQAGRTSRRKGPLRRQDD